VNITVSSLVDDDRRATASVSGDSRWVEDICLAYLQEIGLYKNWVCLFSNFNDRKLCLSESGADPSTCVPGAYAVRYPASSPPPSNLVSSVINRCTQDNHGQTDLGRRGTVYAFITAPLAAYVKPKPIGDDFVQQNIVWIILVIIAGLLFLLFLMYMAVRLYRYRGKYHEERKEADRLKEEVDNMTQFGGDSGTKDDQVAMTENPLAVQLKHLQQAVKQEDIKLQQAEQGLRLQEADIRKEHIDNMKSNRDKMMAELEKLKAQLAESQAVTAAPTAIDEPDYGKPAAYAAGPTASGDSSDAAAGAYGQHGDGAYRAGFDQYQAPTRGPKKKDLS
jgi:hypothetical protein